jgi:hypothetical protein
MKQGVVFVLASAALLAAVAVAHVTAPLPDGGPFQASAKAATASDATVSSIPRSGGDTSVSKSLVEVRQAPVPLLIRERPPSILSQPAESAAVAVPTVVSDVEGGNFARSAIEADGYRGVKNVVAGSDGTWRARALRGKTEVVLTVDREGRVSAE